VTGRSAKGKGVRRDGCADIGRLYADPLARLERLQQMRAVSDMPMLKARLGDAAYDQMKTTMATHFRREVADLHAGLRAADRAADADAVKAKALELDPSDEMRRALAPTPPNVN
jgi:hypothetical protein